MSFRRFVSGIVAGCTACSDLASRIEERVGDKLAVRSLLAPKVQECRE